MRFAILGPFEAWKDGRELDLGAGRHRALLLFLLLHAGEVVSADRLIDELWEEQAPASAAKLVQGYVSRLRRVLPAGSIVTRDSGYLLVAGETDAADFERLLELARVQPPRKAATCSARGLRSGGAAAARVSVRAVGTTGDRSAGGAPPGGGWKHASRPSCDWAVQSGSCRS